MNIESSRISTIFNSGDSDGPARIKSTFKNTTSLMDMKKKKQTASNANDLNSWDNCDPDKFEDKLPQPFRLINKIIYKTILTKVNSEIERIDKAKLSHNYEKAVREIVATNFFEFNGISCFANHRSNPQNHLLVGDKLGNVMLLDLNKRTLATKKEAIPERRIIDISAVTVPFEDTYLTTFSVIFHATQEVLIFRYKASDYKMNHVFTIKCAKGIQTVNENTEVGDFPFKAVISPDCAYISIILYNGNVEIYKIPEPSINIKGVEDTSTYGASLQPPKPINTGSPPPKGTAANLKVPDRNSPLPVGQQSPGQTSSNDPIELFPFKKIALKSPEIPKDAKDVFLALLAGSSESDPNTAQQEKGKDGKDAPKDKKAPEPKKGLAKEDPKAAVAANPVVDLLKKEYRQNPVKTFKGIKRSFTGDDSDQVEPPIYYPNIYYIQTPIVVQDTSQKQFSFEKIVDLTSDIVCVWNQTTTFDVYELEKVTAESVPTYVLASVLRPPPQSSSDINPSEKSYMSGQSQKKISNFDTKLIQRQLQAQQRAAQVNGEVTVLTPVYSFDTLYPIVCSTISKSCVFLGLGLKDGSIIVWDLVLNQQKFVLDKHKESVTVLTFFEDWRLISGSKDGTVHLYDLQNPANSIKYQHLFQVTGNSIVEIGVNDTGIAFVIDNQRNLRAYDLFHFQKIFKVMPIEPRGKKVAFSLWPTATLNTGKEQLCILVDEVNQDGEVPENWTKKGCILIYRILDNLMATFPGLANIVKKGIDKSKAMIAFTKLQTADLNNPNFDIPLLAMNISPNKKQGDMKSNSNSRHLSHSSSSSKRRTSSQSTLFKDPSLTDLNHTYVSLDKEVKRRASPGPQRKGGLTHESLHPEQYLTQKPTFPKPGLVNPVKTTMDKLREINQDKVLRLEKLQQYYGQIQEELDRQEEYERLQKRKQMLKEVGN